MEKLTSDKGYKLYSNMTVSCDAFILLVPGGQLEDIDR